MTLAEYLPYTARDTLVPDSIVFEELHQVAETIEPISAEVLVHKAPPAEVDLSQYLHYIRWQGGEGCWGYSLLSVWDIMNEMKCPYSPNLSLNLGLFLHRRRDLWEKKVPPGINSPDGRFHKKLGEKWVDQSFGCTTEGTEITNPTIRWTGWWTNEGVNEAHSYRLASDIKKIPTINSTTFVNCLANGHPIQLEIGGKDWGHLVAIVGYNFKKKTFKYANSAGDRWGNNGFGTYTFDEINNRRSGSIDIRNAYTIEIIPPSPVPAARIKVMTPEKGGRRINVNLWLSVEGSPLPKKKIWPPCDSGDNSRNLHYTVRLPSEFIWPPSPGNRLILDLYDSAAFSDTGGTLEEFTAAFGGHIVKSSQLYSGPVSFKAHEHKRFYIP